MKEIITEWRKFLLTERVSDLMYQELVSFFNDIVLPNWQNYYNLYTFSDAEFSSAFPNVRKYTAWASKKKDRKDLEGPISYTFEQNALAGLKPKTEKLQQIYENFKKFQEQSRKSNPLSQEVSPEKEIIKSEEDFMRLFSPLKIIFFSTAERDAEADMSDDGTMRLFVRADKNLINMLKLPVPGIDNMLQNWVSGILSQPIKKNMISHELAHFINSFRSGFKQFRTSGSGKSTAKQFQPELDRGHYYTNSTEEIQARLTDVISQVVKRLKEGDEKIINLFRKKDFKSFKEDFLNTQGQVGATFRQELRYDFLSGKTKHSLNPVPPVPSVPTNLPPLPPDLAGLNSKTKTSVPVNLPPIPPLPPDLIAKNKKEAEAAAKITLKKKEEIKRKVDNRLLDLYNALKTKVS